MILPETCFSETLTALVGPVQALELGGFEKALTVRIWNLLWLSG